MYVDIYIIKFTKGEEGTSFTGGKGKLIFETIEIKPEPVVEVETTMSPYGIWQSCFNSRVLVGIDDPSQIHGGDLPSTHSIVYGYVYKMYVRVFQTTVKVTIVPE